ncbi:MAG: FkbM family methyltransferase [Acetobacteraceae bacterium]|nr:FkbM family methyltransferase [Acetobacteraceae bacterium]
MSGAHPVLPNLLPTDGFNQLVAGRHGLILFNKNDTVVGQSASHYGEYFESEVDLFAQLIPPGAQVADLGANIGIHTIAMARLTGPTGWVFAFEPQRLVFQTLCANVALNSLTNVECENKAVSDWDGSILVEDLNPNAQVNFGGLELGTSKANRAVAAVKLDSYLNGQHLDFLKADVQGMEEACLRGARETLKRCGTILYLENDQPEKSPSLISCLFEMEYTVHWHLTQFFNAANYANDPNNIHAVGYFDVGGRYLVCNGFAINMLCIPKARKLTINGALELMDVLEHPLTRGPNRFHPDQ